MWMVERFTSAGAGLFFLVLAVAALRSVVRAITRILIIGIPITIV